MSVDTDLLMETLPGLRGDIARVDQKVSELVSRMIAQEKHVAALMHADTAQYEATADLVRRVEKIERRLEISGR